MPPPRKYDESIKESILILHKQHPKWSQTKLAKETGTSQGYVSQVLQKYNDSIRMRPPPKQLKDQVAEKMQILEKAIIDLSKEPITAYNLNALSGAIKNYREYIMQLEEYKKEWQATQKTFWYAVYRENAALHDLLWLVIERVREEGILPGDSSDTVFVPNKLPSKVKGSYGHYEKKKREIVDEFIEAFKQQQEQLSEDLEEYK